MALLDAQLVAAVKRTVATRAVVFDVHPYASWPPRAEPVLRRAARAYGSYLGLEPQVRIIG